MNLTLLGHILHSSLNMVCNVVIYVCMYEIYFDISQMISQVLDVTRKLFLKRKNKRPCLCVRDAATFSISSLAVYLSQYWRRLQDHNFCPLKKPWKSQLFVEMFWIFPKVVSMDRMALSSGRFFNIWHNTK